MMEGWDSFFLGQLGASAALGGLLFVAISINLERILAVPDLPNRALLALLLLLVVLTISAVMLIPQPPLLIGIEALVLGIFVLIAGTAIEIAIGRAPRDRNRITYLVNAGLFALASIPYIVGGILLILGSFAGVYWIAGAIVFSVIKAVSDAWVLLVEIHR